MVVRDLRKKIGIILKKKIDVAEIFRILGKERKFIPLIFSIFIMFILYSTWGILHWLSLAVIVFITLGFLIFIANRKGISIPYIAPSLTRRYFKVKFRIADIHNTIEENRIDKIIKLFFYVQYSRVLYYLIILLKSPEESFNEIREDLQKKHKDVVIVDTENDTIFNIELIEKKIEKGEEINPDILVEYYQKLFELHKRHHKKAAHYSLATLGVMILATVITGTVTSLIFNNTPNTFAATYNFTQNSWAGGVSGTTATHADNQSGWTNYSTSTSGLIADTDIRLGTSTFWFTDDGATSTSTPSNTASGGDFDSGTNSTTTVSGSGTAANVVLSAGRSAGSRTDYTVGFSPNDIAFDSITGSAWILNSSNVSKVNVNTGSKSDYVVGANLEDIAFDSVNGVIWIAQADGQGLSRVNINTGAVTSYNLGIYAKGVAYDSTTNSVWLTTNGSSIVKYNVSTGTSSSYALANYGGAVAFDSTTNSVWTIYPAGNQVAKVNIYTGARTDHSAAWNSTDIVFDNVTNSVWVLYPAGDQVMKINVNTGATTATYSTGDVPKSITFDDVTRSVWVANDTGHVASKIDIYSGTKTDYQALYITDEYAQVSGPQGIAFDNITNSVWIASAIAGQNNVSKMAIGDLYNASGTFTSAVINLGGQSDFSTLDFTASTSASSTLTVDVRAGNTSSPDGTWTGWQTNIADNGSLTALNGNQYVQYRANLATTKAIDTPELNNLKINYIQYVTTANLISSIFDSSDPSNLVGNIAWSETGTTTNETVKFQVRSASSSAGISSAAWCGYTEVSTSTCSGVNYFEAAHNGLSMASTHPLRNGSNDRFFQYKIILGSGGGATPVADNVAVTYVINAAPSVQNFTATQGADGYVSISYEVRDVDSAAGSNTPGYVTPSFEYWNGSSWSTASTFAAGDLNNKAVNTVSTTTYTAYMATWNANADFDGQFLNSNFKMRITINDNEAANNTAQLTSATTTLDTANPSLGAVPIKVIATTSPASVTFSVTDDTTLYMKFSQNSSLSDVDWAPYEAATTTALVTDPDVVYVQFKDAYGNTSAILSATTPETPTSVMAQDTSNLDVPEYRLFVAWKMVALPSPGFGKYTILRSEDNVTYTTLTEITDRSVNYYGDNNVSSTTRYYYKIVTQDANGNKSYHSTSVSDIPDGLGSTDTVAPTISNVQVIATTTQTATIVWDTNEVSNSTVGYSTTAGLYGTEVGNSTMADTSAGIGRHQVVLTNLSADTTYYFQVKSTDPFGNTRTNNNSNNGYTFTTKAGAIISGTTQSEVQNTRATVVWTTDIPADSIVVYSENSNLSAPQTVQGSQTLVTSHSVSLTGLTSNTRYYYYVKSTDGEANIATDDNGGNYYTFLTTQDTAAPTITFDQSSNITGVGTSTATISWTTDQPATSTLAYDTVSGGPYASRVDINNYNYNHSVNLTGLTASTTYYFQLVATDENSNSTTTNNGGAGFSFSTSALPDTTAPVVSLVATSTTISSATISWSTDENASSFVQYATSTDTFETDYIEKGRSATTTSHSVTLTGLTENVTYYFRVRSTDIDGNTVTDNNSGNYYSFTTTRDSTAPTFSSVTSSSITDTSAVITWTTSERATSQVTFGTESGTYSSSTAINSNLNLTHSITLTGLTAGAVYYYRAVSTDASSNTGTSTEKSFTARESLVTESQAQAREAAARANSSGGGLLIIDKNDKTTPIITNIQVQSIKSDSVTITWNTDEDSDSFVEYGIDKLEETSGKYENTRAHTVVLKRLFPESEYKFRVQGKDSAGNLAQSEEKQFKTLAFGADTMSTEGNGSSESVLMATVNKTIDIMQKIASQVSLGTMQSALIAQQNSIEELASMIPGPLMSAEPRVELTPTTATIYWHTDKDSNSLVALVKESEYDEKAANPYKQVLGLPKDETKDHMVILYDLIPDTTYHYQLRSETAIGTNTKSRDFTFHTPEEALEIGGYTVEKVSPEKAAFKWMTNVETDSEVKYAPYRNNMLAVDETRTVRDKAVTRIHDIVISEFESGTVYQIEISGKDAAGNVTSKVIPTFFTSEEDLPPTISQVQTNLAISPGKDSKIQAVISWMTDEPSTSRVFYQKGFAASGTELQEKTPIDPNFTKKHAVVITKFDPGAIYTFKVESTDSGGNTTLSKTYTILAPKQKETVFQVIMKNFESMFGWVGNMKQ